MLKNSVIIYLSVRSCVLTPRMIDAMGTLPARNTPFWIRSNPGEAFPLWHFEPFYYEVKWWADAPTKPNRNQHGVTGWAELCVVGNGPKPIGEIMHLHVCGHTPCHAHWADSKYGVKGPPIHARLAESPQPDVAVAGAESIVQGAESAAARAPVESGGLLIAGGGSDVHEAESAVADGPVRSGGLNVEFAEPAPEVGVEKSVAAESESECDVDCPGSGSEGEGADAAVGHAGLSPAPPAAPSHMMPPLAAPTELLAPPDPKPDAPRAAALRFFRPAGPAGADSHAAVVRLADPTRDQSAVADPCSETRRLATAPRDPSAVLDHCLPTRAHAAVLRQMLRLARSIRQPRTTIGYIAFIIFALAKKCRPIMWEGECPIDLIDHYAPWARERCTQACSCDGVACVMSARSCGLAEMHPITDAYPLGQTRHWLAAVKVLGPLGAASGSIETFYIRLGMVVVGTVTDNDCGIDLMCMMLNAPQNAQERRALREEISDYLLQRLETPWMHDLMVACQEMDAATLDSARSCGLLQAPLLISAQAEGPIEIPDAEDVVQIDVDYGTPAGPDAMDTEVHAANARSAELTYALFGDEAESNSDVDDGPDKTVATAESAVAGADPTLAIECFPAPIAEPGEPPDATALALQPESPEEVLKALAWATGTDERGVLVALQGTMPAWSIQEQLALYKEHQSTVVAKRAAARMHVQPTNLHNRNQVAAAFHRHLQMHHALPPAVADSRGKRSLKRFGSYWTPPKHVWSEFLGGLVWAGGQKMTTKWQRSQIKRWYFAWLDDGKVSHAGMGGDSEHE